MSYKYDPKNKYYIVWHCKRHPVTRQPVTLRRQGPKTEAEARRLERELIIKVEEKFRKQIVPIWPVVVEKFLVASLDSGKMTEKTADNYRVCLMAHTYEAWENRHIDEITTQEIRELIKARVWNYPRLDGQV